MATEMAGPARGFPPRFPARGVIGVAIAIGTLLLTVAAHRWDRFAGDLRIAREVQRIPAFDPIAEAIRLMTATELVVPVGLLIASVVFIRGRRADALVLAALFLLLPIAQAEVKELVDRPRPPAWLVEIRGSATSPSFPSGHVMSGTVLFAVLSALVLASPLGPALRGAGLAGLAVLAAINGLANVYEGVHWPSDVLGGYLWAATLLGAAWAALTALHWRLRGAGA